MNPRARWVILGFSLIGLALAGASSYVHYRLLTDPTYVSPCDLNHTFNCSQVYLSRFGNVGGVPVALGGVIWFALMALVVGLAAPRGHEAAESDPVSGYVFALATVGLAVILYLGYASFVVLHNACILCMGTYVCVVAIFVTAGLTATTKIGKLPGRLVGDLRRLLTTPLTLVLSILYVVGAATAFMTFPREARQVSPAPAPTQNATDRFAQIWAAQPRVDLGVPADGAKVVIVKFNDWMCPACKSYYLAYEPIIQKYASDNPGAVKTVVKDWPWNTSCNFNVATTFQGHEASCDAAVAVRIAREHGKGDDMFKWIFDNQQMLEEAGGDKAIKDIRAKATELAGVTDYDREYAIQLAAVKRDVADGGVLKIQATPTYFVNGVRTTDAATGNNLPPAYLDLAIKLELNKPAGR